MANWEQFKTYAMSRYTVADHGDNFVKIVFGFDSGRSQVVFLWHEVSGDDVEWVKIESPVGGLLNTNVSVALRETQGLVCGGLGLTGDFVVYRHAVPLATLDPDDFSAPLDHVVIAADLIEKAATGGDAF